MLDLHVSATTTQTDTAHLPASVLSSRLVKHDGRAHRIDTPPSLAAQLSLPTGGHCCSANRRARCVWILLQVQASGTVCPTFYRYCRVELARSGPSSTAKQPCAVAQIQCSGTPTSGTPVPDDYRSQLSGILERDVSNPACPATEG